MEALFLALGVSDPGALPRMFPDVEPEIKVVDSDGAEVDGPDVYEALGPEKFPVIFKIKLPKAPEKKADGVAAVDAIAKDAVEKGAAITDGTDKEKAPAEAETVPADVAADDEKAAAE